MRTETDVRFMPLHRLAGLLQEGELTSAELVRILLDVIAREDGRLGAYLEVNDEEALEGARAADAARAGGRRTPLLGLPLAVKDIFNVRGQSCTCASRILEGYRAPFDATVIARLREAGAVFLGRTNMDEFAMGSSTEHSARGPTRNPWNPERVPGGSSGGSAAAVAAGEAVAALGTDTGGSIRQPAAFCGCVGLKPTYGRVSRYGIVAYASSLDQAGPLTRDVRDAALLLRAMAGPDPLDATSLTAPVPDYEQALTDRLDGLRIGLPVEYFASGVEPAVEQAVRDAVRTCRALGAETEEVSLPHTRHAVASYYLIATAEASANLARFDGVRYGLRAEGDDPLEMYVRTRAAGFGKEVKRRIILGTYALSSGFYDAYYRRAQQVRALILRDFEEVFQKVDVLITPVSPTPAYRFGAMDDSPLHLYLQDIFTVPANLAGLCGLALPCAFTTDQLPLGVQILGPPLGEEVLLRTGHALEQALALDTRPVPPPTREGAA